MASLSTKPDTRTCSHSRHVGTCPSCQRTQLARWSAQLAAVTSVRALHAS